MEPYAPAEEALKEFAGSYVSDELDVRYEIQLKSGALHIEVGHNGDMELVAQKKDLFLVGDLGKIQFRRSVNGAITGFEVSTGRVLNLKFRKV
jgi:hypothetical protein